MRHRYLLYALPFCFASAVAQKKPVLTVEKIMQDPKWIGTAPSNPYWAEDGSGVYFSWNPDKAKGDSLYLYDLRSKKIAKVADRRNLPAEGGVYNRARTVKLYEKNGDLFWLDIPTRQARQLTNTVEAETSPTFSGSESKVIFRRGLNLFSMNLASGEVAQLTQFITGAKKADPKANEQEKWLKTDQLAMFDILKERADKKKDAQAIAKAEQPKRPKEIYLDDRSLQYPSYSPDGRFVTFQLVKAASGAKSTIVPNYVTESGFTEDIPARTKVGAPASSYSFFVYDIQKDTVREVPVKDIPGIRDVPAYIAEYGKKIKPADRPVQFFGPSWSEDGTYAVVIVRSQDNKDRWLLRLNPATLELTPIDRLRDEAWVGGPGSNFLTWIDRETILFHSEATGYSHLYSYNLRSGEKKQLTSGSFEVQVARLSNDKKNIYFQSNEVHPGEQHWYRMTVTGGERVRLTTQAGANDVTLSPDESKLLIRYSAPTKPWELYLQDNRPNATPEKITESLTGEFKAYPWREPQVITVKARDGKDIYARLYVPKKKNGAAVIFVHGAGYLQNAHKWWSQYFREYMFHNLLADKGYTVIDMDYRGSAGYGRDWRTGIYRFMGGKDLDDHVDGAKYLTQKLGIDPKRIGMYGGSYGGFMTLMALFTQPGVFKAGAALRPVTDWAAYNHPYTANILNQPQDDSLAYRRSSPIYHAAGLKDNLLICHGMVDVNVHFQDAVRLSQRLIELRKENWELAAYPMEDHGFVEPTSWMDEYKRILKLFEDKLR